MMPKGSSNLFPPQLWLWKYPTTGIVFTPRLGLNHDPCIQIRLDYRQTIEEVMTSTVKLSFKALRNSIFSNIYVIWGTVMGRGHLLEDLLGAEFFRF